MNKPNSLIIRQLGLQDYLSIYEKMRKFTDQRDENTPDELWLLEHPPVFTQGRGGKAEHILKQSDIPIIASDRGGQITYHGPGQLIGYCLIDLKRRGIHLRELIDAIEQSIIAVLQKFNIQAELIPTQPGVYVKQAKIASLGLHIRKNCSYHGFALNVKMDLQPFQFINPCGFKDMKMTQMSELGFKGELTELADLVSQLMNSKLTK